ncbi:MAG: MmgE/PrpD family protein [Alphaproteobacteria bacterium]
MSLTATIAAFLCELDERTIPPEVMEKARACLLNGYGIALGCHATPYAPIARETALALDGLRAEGATLLGDGRRSTVPGAALANAALFHGRAQEDTCGAAHIGAIVIPLLTAMIEAEGYPLDRLLPSLVAGYEAGGLLEGAYGRVTSPAGFRASPLYGTVAAAAAAARLMQLPPERMEAAIANAVSFTGGLLQSFAEGTDEWRYQVGVTARNGLIAATLARAGSVSARQPIEGRAGFVRAFVREECDVGALAARLGRDWATMRVAFKPYPVCAFNQTLVGAALALKERVGDRPIEGVTVRMNPFETGYAGMDAKGPFATISGTLMSIPFCAAAPLLRGMPTMALMTTYDDAAINALTARVRLESDPAIPTLSCKVAVTLADGATIEEHARKTAADYSYSRDEVSALIRRIGREEGVPAVAYDRLEAFVGNLPEGAIEDVIDAFAPITRRAAA